MKALSIKQPWASLIVHGIKDIENRTWATKHRGRIYVHSSGTFFKDFESHMTKDRLWDLGKKITDKYVNSEKPTSEIIGEVSIVDCVINHPSVWAEKTEINADFEDNNAYVGKPIYNWVLANPVLYDQPILNVNGKLSLWEFNKEVII